MASFYTVVRYVPDPIADERINIGVIVFGAGIVLSKFVTNWQRAQALGNEDLHFLRKFAREVQAAASSQVPLLPLFPRWSEDVVREYAGSWHNSIQLSEPRASLQPPEKLLKEVVRLFLSVPQGPSGTRRYRNKRAAIAAGKRSITSALEGRFGLDTAQRLLHTKKLVAGRFDTHNLDIVLKNGHVLMAAQGLSFQLPDHSSIETEIEITAWAVDDIRKAFPDLPLAVLAVPPVKPTRSYARAKKIFSGLNVALVDSWGGPLQDWADAVVGSLELPYAAHQDRT